MDTTVTHLGGLVVAALRAAGYAESTVGQYEKTIRALDGFVAERGGAYTAELGASFASLTTSPRTGRFSVQRRSSRARLVTLFDALLVTGAVPLGVRSRGGGGRRPVSAGFVGLDAAWEADMAERALAVATREAYGRVARGYLTHLEDHGINSLDQARADTITGFLESLVGRGWAEASLFWVVSNFRPFLVFAGRRDLVDAVNLVGVRRPRPVVPVVTDDDVRRVVDACVSPGTVPSRDASITLLALLTGLRACDIIDLRLGDIDWRAATISIVQRKTGNPLILPIPDAVAARLADYVLTGRPRTGDDHVSCGGWPRMPRCRAMPRSTRSPLPCSPQRARRGPRREPGCCGTRRRPGCCARGRRCRRSPRSWATPARNRPAPTSASTTSG